MKSFKASGVLFATLILLISCASRSNSGLQDRNEAVSIQISASNLDVFDATSQVFIDKGFAIASTNDRLGLITTDYKDVTKTVGNSFLEGLFGMEETQVMLSTSIRSTGAGCLLNILPKGRAKKSKKKDYVEITISKKFIKNIEAIGQEIKSLAESNISDVAKEQSNSRNEAPDSEKKKGLSRNTAKERTASIDKNVAYSNFQVRIIATTANVRLKPNLQSKIISSVPLGAILEVQNKEGDWYLVMLPVTQGGFNVTGYIHQSVVEEYR